MIKLTIPSIDEVDLEAVCEVLDSGYLVQGKQVEAFEDKVADYVGVNHAIAVSNCTAALHLSLIAIGVKPDDLVIVPSYSFPATANVIELTGGRPVFVDIDPHTYNIDPNRLEDELERLLADRSTANKVKAILPVHLFGQMAEMAEILKIAQRYHIPVIEDAACALGASMQSKPAGTWGSLGCFSFHPRKTITTGEGGVITTNDSTLANRIRTLRNHGLDHESSQPDFVMPGFNYRMTEFQAALGQSQISKIDQIISTQRRLAAQYTEAFTCTPFDPPVTSPNSKHIFQSYVILLPPVIARRRDELISYLLDQGVETTIGTWHIPLTSYYRNRYGYKPGDFPHTDEIFSRSLTIPLYESLRYEQQVKVVDALVSCIDKYR